MRFAVLADTHNRLPQHLGTALAKADEIWHLGDVCDHSILDQLAALGPPLLWVRGNCDSAPDWPQQLNLVRAGLRIRLVHIPPTKAADTDILLHGHTHVPRHERIGNTLFLNPGCITRPNQGAPASYAWLELCEDRPPQWSLVKV